MIRLGQNMALDLKLLRDGLHNKIGVRKGRHVRDGKHSFQYSCFLCQLQLSSLNFTVKILCDCIDGAVQKSLLNVAQQHLVAGARKHVRDAVTHGARPKHSHSSDGINRQAASFILRNEPSELEDARDPHWGQAVRSKRSTAVARLRRSREQFRAHVLHWKAEHKESSARPCSQRELESHFPVKQS